jgi:hypothetical protein
MGCDERLARGGAAGHSIGADWFGVHRACRRAFGMRRFAVGGLAGRGGRRPVQGSDRCRRATATSGMRGGDLCSGPASSRHVYGRGSRLRVGPRGPRQSAWPCFVDVVGGHFRHAEVLADCAHFTPKLLGSCSVLVVEGKIIACSPTSSTSSRAAFQPGSGEARGPRGPSASVIRTNQALVGHPHQLGGDGDCAG